MRRRRLVWTMVVALTGCAPSPPSVEEEAAVGAAAVRQDTVAAARIACDELSSVLLKAGFSRESLFEAFGAPDSVVWEAVPNRHVEGVTDTLFVVHYPDAEFGYHRPGGGRDLLDRALVRANRYLRHPELGVGAPAERLVRAIGIPDARTPERVVYECGDGAEEPVTFWLDGGVVRAVEIDFYVD